MVQTQQARFKARPLMWIVLACAACACSSTSVATSSQDGGPTSCDKLAGTWDVTACGVHGQCTVAQQTCSLSVVCSAFLLGQGTASGTIDHHDFTFSSDAGTCTGSVSASALAGTCTDADGGQPCNVTGTRTP